MALTKDDLKAIDGLIKTRLEEQDTHFEKKLNSFGLDIDAKLAKLQKNINREISAAVQDGLDHIDQRVVKLEKIHPKSRHTLTFSD